MKNKLNYLYSLFAAVCLFAAPSVCAADKPLKIVATQTIFADLVKQVGQDKVEVVAIVPPKYNVHFIQPKPSDVRKVARADFYVHAGLDLEVWSDSLLEAAGRPELFKNGPKNIDLSLGVKMLDVPQGRLSRAGGDIHLFGNPHFHMNPANAKVMAAAIAKRLAQADPANAAYYAGNTRIFLEKLEAKIVQWQDLCASIRGKEIFSYHADIAYFADFLGLKAEQFLESKPGIPPTPKHLVFLEDYAREYQVKAIVLPTYYSRNAADALAHRINAKVALIAHGVGELAGTEDFFSFFDYNFNQISEALK